MSLSPLQQQVVAVVEATQGTDDVALAGGAALIAWGIGDRLTKDLDFFATKAETVDALAPRLQEELRERGLHVTLVRSSPGFARFEVSDSADTTELDLAWDYRIRPVQRTALARVLDRDELAADKMLALYARAEARDFVDVFRLRELYSRERLCELAHEKDRGFVADMFADALSRLDRRDRIEFDVDNAMFGAMLQEFLAWRIELEHPPPDLGRRRHARDVEPPEINLGP